MKLSAAVSLISIVVSLFLLAGCQTSGYVSSAATDGNGITCGKIQQAFAAYRQDRQSALAWQQLAQLIDAQAGSLAQKGVAAADEHFAEVRASVNLALLVRGCQPLPN